MRQPFLSIEQFDQLLQKWAGRTVKITKHEMDDIDETILNVKNITYTKNGRSIDGYVSMYSLLLNGDGDISTTMNSMEELPHSMYEIPLQDDSLYEFDGEKFLISTDRGVYKIGLV